MKIIMSFLKIVLTYIAPKFAGNGPGKALRQTNTISSKSPSEATINSLANSLNSASISNKKPDPTASNPSILKASIMPNSSLVQTTIDLRNERFSKQKLQQQSQLYQQYNNYSMNLTQAEELAKTEKFKNIISSNPVNLGKTIGSGRPFLENVILIRPYALWKRHFRKPAGKAFLKCIDQLVGSSSPTICR